MIRTNLLRSSVLAAVTLAVSTVAAHATILTVFDGIADGTAAFDSTVTGAGATVNTHEIDSALGADQGDFIISNNDGGGVFFQSYGTITGDVVGIDPATVGSDNGSGVRDAPLDYFDSGFTLTFDSAVNSLGFEVGDWATCCHDPVTELYISFDGGAPILVGSADEQADGLFPSQNNPATDVFEIFVAAFDDSGSFSEVAFWGNGIGEFLVAGGTVRYALVDEGSLPPPDVIPLPASVLLLGGALVGLGFLRRRA